MHTRAVANPRGTGHLTVSNFTAKSMLERVLIVGCGSAGSRHLELIRSTCADAKILMLCFQGTPEKLSCTDRLTRDFNEALNFYPQLAVVANPASFHTDIAVSLLELGCNVLIEKPLAIDTIQGNQILAAFTRSGSLCEVGYNLRFAKSLELFKEYLDSGYIGRCFSVRCEVGSYLPSWRPGTDYRRSVSANSALGGGVLLELSHEIDYLTWIFGDIAWISCWSGRLSNLEVDVEDCAKMIIGIKSTKYGQQIIASLNMDFFRQDNTRMCTVLGSKGTLRWNGILGTVESRMCDETEWRTIYTNSQSIKESYQRQLNHFLFNCKNKDNRCGKGLKQALRVIEVIEAAKRSSREFSRAINLT